MAKKPRRRFSATSTETVETSTNSFDPDYTYVVNNLKRIGTLAVIFIGVLVVLSFIL